MNRSSDTLPIHVNKEGQIIADTDISVDLPIRTATAEDVRLINMKLDRIDRTVSEIKSLLKEMRQ